MTTRKSESQRRATRIYVCPFPGCSRELRSRQSVEIHWVRPTGHPAELRALRVAAAAGATYTDRVLAVACPKCGALKDAPCRRWRGGERAALHIDRVELAGEAAWQRRAAQQKQLADLVARLVRERRKARPSK